MVVVGHVIRYRVPGGLLGSRERLVDRRGTGPDSEATVRSSNVRERRRIVASFGYGSDRAPWVHGVRGIGELVARPCKRRRISRRRQA